MQSKLKKLILLLGDIIWLYLALYLTLMIRYLELPSADKWQKHFWPFTIIFFVWVIVFYISNLYNLRFAVNDSKFIATAFRSFTLAGLFSALFFYLNPTIGIAPKTNLIIFLVVFSVLFLLWRRLYNWLLKAYLPRDRVAFIGYNEQVKELIGLLRDKPQLGYDICFTVSEQPRELINEVANITDTRKINEVFKQYKISNIIFATNLKESPHLQTALFNCLPLKVNFFSIANFYELATGKVPIEAISQMWFLENLSEGSKTWFDLIKRCYDIILALVIFIFTLPFWLLIAAVIKIESHGPIFYYSTRIGRGSKEFRLIKFRTMREENNDRTPTKANDPRVTSFGSFLRKTRIDELPQALNILLGDMSFVGPRPERPELVKQLEQAVPFYRERMLVKPGLTGWDQISGEYHSPSLEDTLKKLQFDLFYIKNRSLYLDLSIILKTIATVISRAGV